MAKILLIILSALLCAVVGQDIEPELLEPDITTTTTLRTTTTEEPITTPPIQTSTISIIGPLVTDGPEIATSTSTTTPPEPTTTTTLPPSIITTSTETVTSTSTPTPTTTTTTSSYLPQYPQQPQYPFYPSYPDQNRCYFKSQQGPAYWSWMCGRMELVYSMECYYCCWFSSSGLTGCNRVHNYYCKSFQY